MYKSSDIRDAQELTERDVAELALLREYLASIDIPEAREENALPKVIIYESLISTLNYLHLSSETSSYPSKLINAIVPDQTQFLEHLTQTNYTVPWLVGCSIFQAAIGQMLSYGMIRKYRIIANGTALIQTMSRAHRVLKFLSTKFRHFSKQALIMKNVEAFLLSNEIPVSEKGEKMNSLCHSTLNL